MPNSVRNIMGAGEPALVAQMASGTIADGLTATGSTQATGYAMSTDTAVFTTVAASTGAVLPGSTLAQPGDEVVVANLGANALSVYPPVGGAINSLAANTALSVAAGKVAYFIARNGGLNWVGVLSA
jgi:hypothetical protein